MITNGIATIRSFLQAHALIAGVLVVLLITGIGFFLLTRGDGKEQLLTVARGEFVQAVSVSGKVVAAQEVDLGFSGGGRVSGVYAKVGDRVGAGTILAEIENGDLRANVLQREAAVGREEAKLASLRAGSRPEDVAVSESAVESAKASLEQANRALLEEIEDAYRSADDAIKNQIDQFITNPRSANPQLSFIVADSQIENDIEFKRLQIEAALTAWQQEVTSLSSTSDLLRASETAQKNLAGAGAVLVAANAALNRAVTTATHPQATIDAYVVDIAAARSAVNTEAAALTSAVTAQKNAAASLTTAERNLTLKKAPPVQADIDAQVAQVSAAKADLESARAQLGKTLLRAPFSGIVTRMDLKKGAIASSNSSDVSMISSGTFQIESFVPEVNIALLEVGDSAVVTLDAYGRDALFAAHVISIDPAETERDGVSTYRAILEFENNDGRIKSGMTANVRISTDKRDNVIAIPRGAVLERGGKKYVTVKEERGAGEREVTTGPTDSLGNIEITSGLSEGDVVVLSTSQ